jgi:hypothetical protein
MVVAVMKETTTGYALAILAADQRRNESPAPPGMKPLRLRAAERSLAHQHEMANVEHILDAIGRKHLLRGNDRRGLREDIDAALFGHRLARETGNTALRRRQHKAIEDQLRKAIAFRKTPRGERSSELDGQIAATERDLRALSPDRALKWRYDPSALLVGMLSRVFERRFGIVAGYTKKTYSDTDTAAQGPFISFVLSVLGEAGIKTRGGVSYASNSISDALTRFRKAKKRKFRVR